METTGRALVDHWDWAADRGLMNKNTAGALRIACSEVLGIDPDWETKELSTLDVEAHLTRFQNLRAKNYKPESLNVYKARFRRALSQFLDYTKDPAAWKPGGQDRPARQNGGRKRPAAEQHDFIDPRPEPGAPLGTDEYIVYPFPLREGRIVRLILPPDLKASEAKRLSAFVATLAVDYEGVDSP
jgi:hypothetical protein